MAAVVVGLAACLLAVKVAYPASHTHQSGRLPQVAEWADRQDRPRREDGVDLEGAAVRAEMGFPVVGAAVDTAVVAEMVALSALLTWEAVLEAAVARMEGRGVPVQVVHQEAQDKAEAMAHFMVGPVEPNMQVPQFLLLLARWG